MPILVHILILLVFEILEQILFPMLFLIHLHVSKASTNSEVRWKAGVKCFPSELKLGRVDTDELSLELGMRYLLLWGEKSASNCTKQLSENDSGLRENVWMGVTSQTACFPYADNS